jgi:hypothetical protein
MLSSPPKGRSIGWVPSEKARITLFKPGSHSVTAVQQAPRPMRLSSRKPVMRGWHIVVNLLSLLLFHCWHQRAQFQRWNRELAAHGLSGPRQIFLKAGALAPQQGLRLPRCIRYIRLPIPFRASGAFWASHSGRERPARLLFPAAVRLDFRRCKYRVPPVSCDALARQPSTPVGGGPLPISWSPWCLRWTAPAPRPTLIPPPVLLLRGSPFGTGAGEWTTHLPPPHAPAGDERGHGPPPKTVHGCPFLSRPPFSTRVS